MLEPVGGWRDTRDRYTTTTGSSWGKPAAQQQRRYDHHDAGSHTIIRFGSVHAHQHQGGDHREIGPNTSITRAAKVVLTED